MNNGKIKFISLLAGLVFSINANAGLLLVEQYDNFWSADVNQLKNYANNNAASSSGSFGLIDFTDDPNGFAGDIPGSNRWPSADAANASGTGHSLNNTFFARITGDFYVDLQDDYFFRTFNDDGVFLYIDDLLTINDGTLHPESKFEGMQNLTQGMHSIEMYFFENGGEASLEFTIADSSRNFMHFNNPNGPVSLVKVPEPTTLFIFALGMIGLATTRRKV